MKKYLTYLVFVSHNHLMTSITRFKLHILDHNILTIVILSCQKKIVVLFYFNNQKNIFLKEQSI